MPATPSALAITGDETGSVAWRIWQPFAELRSRGFVAHSVHTDESVKFLPLIAAGQYNVIVTPRLAWPGDAGKPWQNSIRKAGLTWVYEVDDDVYSEAISGRQSRIFEKERAKGPAKLEEERQQRIRVLAECDAITVSSQRLASVIRSHAPEDTPVYVVPNAIDAKWFRSTLRGCDRLPELKGKLTIGWAGGTRDEMDFDEMAVAWGILAEKYPDIHFVIQGHISQKLEKAVPQHRRSTLPWLPVSEYPRGLLNMNIGCCSVAPNIFSSAKTPIKWFEYALARIPAVVSPTLYGPVVTDGYDALVARTVDDWVDRLSILIESEERRREIADNARTTVMTNHSLERNWWRWPAAWSDAIEQYHEKKSRQLVRL